MKRLDSMMEVIYDAGWRVNVKMVKIYYALLTLIMGVVVSLLSTIWASTTNYIIATTIVIAMVLEYYICSYLVNWKPSQRNPFIVNRSCKQEKPVSLQDRLLEHKDNIIAYRNAGYSYQRIAEKYNCSRTSITRFIKTQI